MPDDRNGRGNGSMVLSFPPTVEAPAVAPQPTAPSWPTQPGADGGALLPTPTPTGSRRRRWPIAVGIATMVIVVATAGAITYASYTSGEQRKSRSQEWQGRAGALQTRLTRSEADAEALQERLDGLANEKAQAQDERNTAQTERDLYQGLAELASDAAVDVAACQSMVSDTLSATISQLGNANVAWASLEAMVSQLEGTCAVADASYQQFADAVNSL